MKVYLVSDVFGSNVKEELAISLSSRFEIINIGEIATGNELSEDMIVTQLENRLNDYSFSQSKECMIALTSSGNGVQIYANKIKDIVAAPCINEEMIIEAIDDLNCSICDIPIVLEMKKITNLSMFFIEKFYEHLDRGGN